MFSPQKVDTCSEAHAATGGLFPRKQDSLPRTTAEVRMCSNCTFNPPYAFVALGQLDLYLYILWVLPDVSDVLPECQPLNQLNDNSTYKTNFTCTYTYTQQMYKISSDLVQFCVCKFGLKYDTIFIYCNWVSTR